MGIPSPQSQKCVEYINFISVPNLRHILNIQEDVEFVSTRVAYSDDVRFYSQQPILSYRMQ